MEDFLKKSKIIETKINDYEKIKVVLGNESLDLDSAVCTIVHGYWLYHKNRDENIDFVPVLPVLNVPKSKFNIKTEVTYFFKKHGVPMESLTFRDQVNLQELSNRKKLELCLVDHHTLSEQDASLADSVVQVIDHRPQDPNSLWTGRDINLAKVGSCATLIARTILEENSSFIDPQIANLLIGTILIDTSNFSEQAARSTQTDIDVIGRLEELANLSSTKDYRDVLYSDILKAKSDISSLTPYDLLIKDLKFVNKIPICGFPILVKEFLNLNCARDATNSFTSERECRITILLGMDFKGGAVRRDLAVFSFLPNDLENRIISALTSQSDLELTLVETTSEENWCLRLYIQGNVRATRKQILPIIQSATSQPAMLTM